MPGLGRVGSQCSDRSPTALGTLTRPSLEPWSRILTSSSLHSSLGRIKIAVVGRVDHRNVNSLLMALTRYEAVQVILVPFTGQANQEVLEFCRTTGLTISIESSLTPFTQELDAIYVNGAETAAHAQLLVDRNLVKVKIDQNLLQALRTDCVILDPMQRTESLTTVDRDSRWAGYRQAENGLFVRMAVLLDLLDNRYAAVDGLSWKLSNSMYSGSV